MNQQTEKYEETKNFHAFDRRVLQEISCSGIHPCAKHPERACGKGRVCTTYKWVKKLKRGWAMI